MEDILIRNRERRVARAAGSTTVRRDHNPALDDLTGEWFSTDDSSGGLQLVDYMGTEASILRAARQSYKSNTRKTHSKGDDRRLIHYLLSNGHTSPFEQAELVWQMRLPVFVARQMVRHRTASLNEVSGRYSEFDLQLPEEETGWIEGIWYPCDGFRVAGGHNKQGSVREEAESPDDNEARWDAMHMAFRQSVDSYNTLVEKGVANELARTVLPLSLYTDWTFKVDLHNALKLIGLRYHPHAQKEIQVYAEIMYGMIQRGFPNVFEAYEKYVRCAVTFNKDEIGRLQAALGTSVSMDLSGLGARELDSFLAKLKTIGLSVSP